MAEVLLSRRVQEMVISGEEPLGPYLCRNDKDDPEQVSAQNSPIPVINIGCFFNGKLFAKESEEELDKLKSALSTWGCFQAIDHGIPSSIIDKVVKVGREFFEQPMEEKKKYGKTVIEFEGYGGDPVPEEGQSLDWSDRLVLKLVPEDTRNYIFWPQKPTYFKETVDEYTEKMKMLTEVISKAMARSIKLKEKCFLDQFGERAMLDGRFNYYSTCQRPDLVLGLKPHADGSGYTIVLQDEEGLQILNNGKWFTAPNNPHTFLVLMGDQMEIMSNGIFKSPVHRVVSNAKWDRFSVAVFYTPECGKEIGPEEGLVKAETPKRFENVRDYADIHWGYYQRGLRSLYAYTVK